MTEIYQCPQIEMYDNDPPLVKMMVLVYNQMIDLGNFWLRFKPHYHQWLWKQSHTLLALTDGSQYRSIAERALAMKVKNRNNDEPQQLC